MNVGRVILTIDLHAVQDGERIAMLAKVHDSEEACITYSTVTV